MREILKLSVVLLLICAVVSGLLAYTNQLTAPLIAESRAASAKAARIEVVPDASEFEMLPAEDTTAYAQAAGLTSEDINEIYAASVDGQIVGYTIKATVGGFGGDVEILTGIYLDGTIGGVRVLTHNETPGLGANAKNIEWISQYNDKNFIDNPLVVTKVDPVNDSEIQAITGATITSDAVTLAVNNSRLVFLELLAGGNE